MSFAPISLQPPSVSVVDVVQTAFRNGNRFAENIATVENRQSQVVGLGGVIGTQHQNVYSLCGRLATEHLPANHGAIFTGEASTAVFTAGSMLGVAKGLHNGEVTACADDLKSALTVFQAAWRNRLVGTHVIGIDGTKEGEQEYYAYERMKECTVALCEAIEEHFSPASTGQHSGDAADRLRPIAARYFAGVVAPFVQKSAEDTFQFVAKPASNDGQASQDYTHCLNEQMLKQLDGQWSGASNASASKFELIQKMLAAFAKVPESILSDKTTSEAATSPVAAATNPGSPGMTGNTLPPIHITQNGGTVTQNGASNTNTMPGLTSGTSHELQDLHETMRQQLQITGQLVDTARQLLGLSGSGSGASLTSIGNRQDRIVRPRTEVHLNRMGDRSIAQGSHEPGLNDLLQDPQQEVIDQRLTAFSQSEMTAPRQDRITDSATITQSAPNYGGSGRPGSSTRYIDNYGNVRIAGPSTFDQREFQGVNAVLRAAAITSGAPSAMRTSGDRSTSRLPESFSNIPVEGYVGDAVQIPSSRNPDASERLSDPLGTPPHSAQIVNAREMNEKAVLDRPSVVEIATKPPLENVSDAGSEVGLDRHATSPSAFPAAPMIGSSHGGGSGARASKSYTNNYGFGHSSGGPHGYDPRGFGGMPQVQVFGQEELPRTEVAARLAAAMDRRRDRAELEINGAATQSPDVYPGDSSTKQLSWDDKGPRAPDTDTGPLTLTDSKLTADATRGVSSLSFTELLDLRKQLEDGVNEVRRNLM